MVLRVESKASHLLGKSFTVKPHPQPPPTPSPEFPVFPLTLSPEKKQSAYLCFVQPKTNLFNNVSFQAWCYQLPMTELPFAESVYCGKGDRQ